MLLMNLNLKYLFLFCILFFYGSVCISQSYNFKNYNTDQGLPQSQVLAIFQDHSGMMWFGTNSGGVGKYDGNKFTTVSDNEGLINNVVFSIAENSKHEMLFGTSKGLSVYNGFSYKNYSEKDGLSNSWIFNLRTDDKDNVWIGTQEGVYILKNEKISRFGLDTVLAKASVFYIFVDSQKRVWFATINNGAICYNPSNGSFKHYTKANGLQEQLVFSIVENADHEIILGTVGGINIVDSKGDIRKGDYIPRQFYIAFRSMLITSKNEQWLGTSSDGLYKFANNALSIFGLKNGLTYNSILCLYEDREHNVWIGTDGSGVYKYLGERFTNFTTQNGLPENYINTITQDQKGNYWVAVRTNGISKIEGSEITSYKFNRLHTDAIPDNDITSCIAASDGKLFFGTRDGLCIYANDEFKTISGYGFRHKYILSLYEDSKKNIWIGTNDGLFKYTNSVITEATAVNASKQTGIPFPIFSIVEDKTGAIWAATENGAVKYENEQASHFSNKTNFKAQRVLSITKDYLGNLWFGTEEGLFNYNYKEFTKISQKNGLSSNFINFLQTDNLNRLLIGTNTGLDILTIKDFYANKISIKHFGKNDGLLSVESNFNASFKDKTGRILIGTPNGLEIYNPSFDSGNILEPLTHVSSVKLFFGQEDIFKYAEKDSITLLPKALKLPFSKNHLTFQFVGISLTAPEKVMYQYKLEGLDNDWTPPTSKTEATYSSLPPGKYKFMLKAMNNDGVWNQEPVVFEFEISPPWYNTWWFYTLCAIVLIGSISLYNYVRTKKLIADKQKLEQVVDERTKELRDEKEKVESINKEVIEQKTIIEHKNVEITDSIKYAKNIQEALLPNLGDIHSLFGQSFVLYMPKDIVSGDFYWFARNGNTRFIAAVDCTGHGVPGAFMSIVGNTLLNEIVNEKKITRPGDILLELHKGVKIALNQNAQEFERRDGMDITLCAFTDESDKVEYAGANRPLWIYRKNQNYELEIIKASKFPIGGLELEEHRVYENHIIHIEEGDCLYLFSDGYADQFGGPKGKKFMLTNLQKTIRDMVELPMPEQKQKLEQTFLSWKQDTEQIDDVLVIGIRI